MPVHYVLCCSKCGSRREAADEYNALQFDDGRIEPLRHPGESTHIARYGLTETQAYAEGRIIVCRDHLCRRCGQITVRRHFAEPCPTGCSTPASIAGAALCAAALGGVIWLRHQKGSGWSEILEMISGWAGLAILVFSAIAWTLIHDLIANWRHRRNFRRQVPNRPSLPNEVCACKDSQEAEWISIGDASGRRDIVCLECGTAAVTVQLDGIS